LEALAVIWAPVRTLARVAEGRRVLLGFIVTVLYAVLSLIGGVIDALGGLTANQFSPRNFPGLPPEFYESAPEVVSVALLIFAVVGAFVWWLLVSALMQLVTGFFGGAGPFSAMLAVVGMASVPFVIQAALQILLTGSQAALGPESGATSVIGALNSLVGLAFLAWHVVLVVIGASFARRVGYGQSAGSCAISCAGLVGLILIVAIVVAILVALLVGAAGSGGPS
jgi:hypothetical protein